MQGNRTSASRPKDFLQTQINDMLFGADSTAPGRCFHLGQVIESNDPKNANRIRVRIPLLDDPFYLDDKGQIKDSIGDDLLPWCVSSNGRFVDTPENGAVVLVGLFDPQRPYLGRIWFSALNELSTTDFFDATRLKEEQTSEAWKNAEDLVNVQYNNTPGERGRDKIKSKAKKTNYNTGVKGKGKNKLLLEKDKSTLIQNEGTGTESLLELTDKVLLTAKKLELISSDSQRREDPVFADPLFSFMRQQLNLMSAIIVLLSTVPGIGNLGINVVPAPNAAQLVTQYTQLQTEFAKLKTNGKSNKIKIN